jgi:PH (Pleckstrin Homology) domain-containing protein
MQTRHIRSRSQTWTATGLGVLFALIFGSQAARPEVAPDTASKAFFIGLGLLMAATMAWIGARPVVIARPDEVTVTNLVTSRHFPWSQIEAFRIGRHKLLGAVAILDLVDGTEAHAFAIQVPNLYRGRAETRESRMIAELNALLAASHEAPGLDRSAARSADT